MPFKEYMILSFIKKPYRGFYTENMAFPYEFSVKVKTWWGLKEKNKIYKVNVSNRLDLSRWMGFYKDRWLKKLPWR